MHFISYAAAALALPVFSMAAVIPEKRQTGNCSGFRYLAVGGISIANTDSGAGSVIVQIRPEGSSKEADWQTVATIKEGTQMIPIPYLANGPGRKRLRVCKSDQCIFPAGEDKQWSMEQSGDRYNFELDVGRRDSGEYSGKLRILSLLTTTDNAFLIQCDSRGRVTGVVTTAVLSTTSVPTVAPPLSTISTTSLKAPTPTPISTTSNNPSTSTKRATKLFNQQLYSTLVE